MSFAYLINFEEFISTKEIFLKYSLLSFTTFFDLEEIIFEILNIFENNISSVELAKVLQYPCLGRQGQQICLI